MKRSNLFAKISGFGFFYRWHPEIAIRYLPVVKEIREMGRHGEILEVGSGGLGIAPYLKEEIVGVDMNFSPPFHPKVKRVIGTATKLPFHTDSFDIVVSIDTLEHLQPAERAKAIGEIIRVAKRKVIIGVPSGETSYQQDKMLDREYRKRFGSSYIFLEEQVNLGLPNEKDFSTIIKKSAKEKNHPFSLRIVGNENLMVRNLLMHGWMTKNIFVNIFFRKILLLFLPILTIIKEPTYRKIFFLDLTYENSN